MKTLSYAGRFCYRTCASWHGLICHCPEAYNNTFNKDNIGWYLAIARKPSTMPERESTSLELVFVHVSATRQLLNIRYQFYHVPCYHIMLPYHQVLQIRREKGWSQGCTQADGKGSNGLLITLLNILGGVICVRAKWTWPRLPFSKSNFCTNQPVRLLVHKATQADSCLSKRELECDVKL